MSSLAQAGRAEGQTTPVQSEPSSPTPVRALAAVSGSAMIASLIAAEVRREWTEYLGLLGYYGDKLHLPTADACEFSLFVPHIKELGYKAGLSVIGPTLKSSTLLHIVDAEG